MRGARPADARAAARRTDSRERALRDIDLHRFHAGDEALFALLVRDYSPRLLPYLRRYVGADADAHDLLQDIWLRVYRKRGTFEGRGSFFGWLLMVTRTVGLAAVSRRRRDPATDELSDIAVESGPDAGMLRHIMQDAVLTLPQRQREVVLLRVIDGRTTAETARLLGCAEGTVKATLHHATRRLQALLKETVE